jgi:Protein of unknown function (DUF3489)
MTKLTTQQRTLLAAIAETEDGAIDATDEGKPTSAALIKRGFLISVPQTNAPSRLVITDAGGVAIGAAPPAPTGPTSPAETAADELAAPPTTGQLKGKTGALVTLLKATDGATIEAMMKVTGWQAHSVRGALSGAIKKNLGLNVVSEKTEAGRVYRIAAEPKA